MRYFTPELWIGFQGSRSRTAFKTWDRRFFEYEKQLARILPGLKPSGARFFRTPLILHDGTLMRMEVGDRIHDIGGALRRDIVNRRKLSVRMFVLTDVIKRTQVTSSCWYVLEYKNVERVDVDYPGKLELFPAGFHPNFGDWGYDELTCPKEKLFRHEILFSSGATIVIEFRDFSFRQKPERRRRL